MKNRWMVKIVALLAVLVVPFVFVACDEGDEGADEGTVFAVTFDLAGGSGEIEEQAIEDGKYVVEPDLPIRNGYNFLGWYDGETKWQFFVNKIRKNTTLVAKWEKDDESWVSSGNIAYEWLGNGEYMVCGFSGDAQDKSAVVIPKMYTGENGDGLVSKIKDNAFAGENLESVAIGGGVREIGAYAFSGTKLSSVVVSSSVETIGAYAFYGVSELATLSFEENSRIKEIKENAFAGTSVSGVIIPSSLEVIGGYAFYEVKLNYLMFGGDSRLTTVGDYAFYNTSLVDLYLPNNLEKIGEFAFAKNSKLVNLVIPVSLTEIDDKAFSDTGTTKMFVYGSKNQLITTGFHLNWMDISSVGSLRYSLYYYSQNDVGVSGNWRYVNNKPTPWVYNVSLKIDLKALDLDLDLYDVHIYGNRVDGKKECLMALDDDGDKIYTKSVDLYAYKIIRVLIYSKSVPMSQRLDRYTAQFYSNEIISGGHFNSLVATGVDGNIVKFA